MDARPLPPRPNLEQYKKLAKDVLKACKSGDHTALRRLEEHFQRPLTRDELRQTAEKRWHRSTGSSKRAAAFALADAQFLVARAHGFESWPRFKNHIEAVQKERSPISLFESAADAVISGDVEPLARLLRDYPSLVRARSTRVHRSTLLHYVSANGVEDYRQKTPRNAVEVAKLLLDAGAEVDATADAYGRSTTLGLVATSIYPAHARVQIPLLETLLAAGADVNGAPGGWSPLIAALHNGRPEAADFLARRGARLDLEGAAGVGRLDVVRTFFNADGNLKSNATREQMESGLMWACEYGQTPVVEFLLDRGMDVGTVVHGMTGLHWALIGGHQDTVHLLLERKAPLELKNCYGGTALGAATWAVMHSDPVYLWPETETDWAAIVKMLLAAGARIEEADYPTRNARVDEVLRRNGAKD